MLKDFDLTQLVEPLQRWFLENRRVLPWREHPGAYYVWISEIMLQQTRVEAVKPYFDRFIRELPDVKALAGCPEDKLLKLWEGLGYYNRVRNLNAAANQIMKNHNGMIPDTYEELIKLKGIGSYTAGAIASIAYGKPYPAVDGNVLRVISRVTADDSDIMKQSVRKEMEKQLLELMEHTQDSRQDDPGIVIPQIFNQALMELGAMVCVPNGMPHCETCPWGELCEARKQNRISELPVKKKAKARRIEERTVLVIKDGEQLALHKRPSKGLLAGMYELPNLEGYLSETEVTAYLREQGYEPVRIRRACDAKHIFSHVEWHMKGYVVFLQAKEYEKEPCSEGMHTYETTEKSFVKGPKMQKNMDGMKQKNPRNSEWIFVDAKETKDNYAIPSAFVKYAEYLNLVLGKDAMK
uniref:A/G-specific adenine glycosylase n=1 Tax=Agathobacter sp. TaxID=2021311 RepID=UPI004056A5D9